MGGLQVAVCEVGGELHLASGVRRLLAQQLHPQCGYVLAADAQQLAELVHLLLALHDGERDPDHDVRERLERLLELAVRHEAVSGLQTIDQHRQLILEYQVFLLQNLLVLHK